MLLIVQAEWALPTTFIMDNNAYCKHVDAIPPKHAYPSIYFSHLLAHG
jgi:hypothetical protein